MLKAAGSFLVICATVLIGVRSAEELKEQYRQMEYVRQLFYRIQSEIRYARSPLAEIFASIGKDAKTPYGAWLLELEEQMGKREGGTFAGLWKTSIKAHLCTSALPRTELKRLIELGDRLGLMDAELQVKTLELYLLQLSSAAEKVHEGMSSRVKLYHCLGIMSGMLIVILLF